ncbi:hypothetical protein PIB30_042645 [Stylosanthes scabra]|uniref:Uncharacterized protein n=1 Tax=Stylosanthes scabra TaxID=79078 RepID=A0ABU6QER1_9FABA|nr:hypothetical protein [Stylosanthes scabra]
MGRTGRLNRVVREPVQIWSGLVSETAKYMNRPKPPNRAVILNQDPPQVRHSSSLLHSSEYSPSKPETLAVTPPPTTLPPPLPPTPPLKGPAATFSFCVVAISSPPETAVLAPFIVVHSSLLVCPRRPSLLVRPLPPLLLVRPRRPLLLVRQL